MATKMNSINLVKDNLDNYYQRLDAAMVIAHSVVDRAFGSLLGFWGAVEASYGFIPSYDKRTKVGKEFAAAQKALHEAMHNYDVARANLIKSTEGKK